MKDRRKGNTTELEGKIKGKRVPLHLKECQRKSPQEKKKLLIYFKK
jgi:hypothetical protein